MKNVKQKQMLKRMMVKVEIFDEWLNPFIKFKVNSVDRAIQKLNELRRKYE